MQAEQVEALVEEVGRIIGIADLALDDGGACTLAVDDGRLELSLLHDPEAGSVTLLTTLPEVAPSELVLASVLEANFLWLGSAGATFALDPESGALVLMRPVAETVDAPALAAAIEGFIETALGWQDELGAPVLAALDPAELEPAAEPGLEGIRV